MTKWLSGIVLDWRNVLIVIAPLLLGMLYVRACWEPSIRADERKRAVDAQVDSQVAIMAKSIKDTILVYKRQSDSTGREIRRLQQRIRDSRTAKIAPRVTIPRQIATSADSSQTSLTDSLIQAYEAGRQQDSLQILFWRATVATQDSLIGGLQRARDSWRKSAERPRHTITDIAGGVALGYGLARENEVAAGVGGALILVPRLVGVVKGVFGRQ